MSEHRLESAPAHPPTLTRRVRESRSGSFDAPHAYGSWLARNFVRDLASEALQHVILCATLVALQLLRALPNSENMQTYAPNMT